MNNWKNILQHKHTHHTKKQEQGRLDKILQNAKMRKM